jgi:hypothetical protein
MMTFAASVNSARERAAGSAIEAKADGDCNPLPPDIWAEPVTDASTAAQLSEVNSASVRMGAVPSWPDRMKGPRRPAKSTP